MKRKLFLKRLTALTSTFVLFPFESFSKFEVSRYSADFYPLSVNNHIRHGFYIQESRGESITPWLKNFKVDVFQGNGVDSSVSKDMYNVSFDFFDQKVSLHYLSEELLCVKNGKGILLTLKTGVTKLCSKAGKNILIHQGEGAVSAPAGAVIYLLKGSLEQEDGRFVDQGNFVMYSSGTILGANKNEVPATVLVFAPSECLGHVP